MYRQLCQVAFLALLLTPAAIAAEGERWLRVAVDHIEQRYIALIYTDAAGNPYVRELDVRQLNIPVPGGPRYRHAAEWYYRADELPEHEVYVDDIGSRVHFVRRWRPHIEPPPSADLLLAVTVNGRLLDEPLLLHFEHGEIDLSESALLALGVNEERVRLLLRDEDQLPLHAIAGERYSLDFQALTLNMTVPPEQFQPVRIDVKPKVRVPPTPAGTLSAMLGYDLASGVDAERERWSAGLFELTIGSGTTMCLSQHVRPAYIDDFRRLDSRCIIDWPQRPLSLNVGDAVTRPGISGQIVRYGGIRFGTDYALAPEFVTQPSLALLGSARVPSTLEVWVDEMLALRQEVLPGVFELTDIPVHTGAGEVRAVVTNVLGVREVVRQSFYSDPVLLARGLSDWAVEAGRLRHDYALEGDHYGERFVLLDYRRGLTDWLTLAPCIEAAESFALVGAAVALRLAQFGVIDVAFASSETDDGVRGSGYSARFSRLGRYVNLSLAHQTADSRFAQLGYPEPGDTPAEQSQASIGISLPFGASFSVGGFRRRLHDGEVQRFHSAALNLPIGRYGSLLLSAFEPVEPQDEPLYAVHFTLPFGARNNVSASAFRQGDIEGTQLGAQRNLPSGPGYGWRVTRGQTNGASVGTAELAAQNNLARLRLNARRADGPTVGEVQLNGSVIAAREGFHLARWQEGSAAVVALPARGVRVYHDERLAAVSGDDGVAVVPGLRPYQSNRLRLESDDLPLDASIDILELRVIPGRRQAVPVDFGIVSTAHVSARLWQASNGIPVPAGAAARFGEQAHPVGFDGLIYIPRPSEAIILQVEWPGGRCEARLPVTESSAAVTELGDVPCR